MKLYLCSVCNKSIEVSEEIVFCPRCGAVVVDVGEAEEAVA